MPRLSRLLLILLIAIVAVCAAGSCFLLPGHDKAVSAVDVPAGATSVAIPKNLYGEPQICAVTGQPFSISRESRSAIYHGRTYYLRDEAALKAFLADPEGYMPDPLPATNAGAGGS